MNLNIQRCYKKENLESEYLIFRKVCIMNNLFGFASGYLKASVDRKIYTAETRPEKYAGKKKLSLQEGNDYIAELLEKAEPCMIARYGSTELSIVKWRLAQKYGIVKEFAAGEMKNITNNAGFFPKDQKLVAKFGDLMLELSKEADLIGVFYWHMEEHVIKNYASQSAVVRARGLEPWYVEKPWTKALKGKKVLVIHPFEDTIKKQYEKRDLLFPETNLLPEFELKTLKAVQTIAGEKDSRFDTWFDALEYMHDEAMKIDFDVAIIGCGAYGFPLAAKLKQSGKKAIHLGGATQYLFGIKSKRAEEGNPIIAGLFNDAWVRPSENERPKNFKNVEGGCYW